jgi:hypothetical protein
MAGKAEESCTYGQNISIFVLVSLFYFLATFTLSPYVPDNAWHSRPFYFRFSAHLLPLFDLRVELSMPPEHPKLLTDHVRTKARGFSTIMDKLACLFVMYFIRINC